MDVTFMRFLSLLLSLFWLSFNFSPAEPVHALARFGTPKYKEGQPLTYVNPEAPKGGKLTFGIVGSFDTLNPFIIKGEAPPGVHLMSPQMVFEGLMVRAQDEPFTLYGLIAEKAEVAEDNSSITFYIDPQAKWSDGKPIVAADVVFTHNLLTEKGRPNLRAFYGRVAKTEALNERTVRFHLKPNDNGEYDSELPLIIALMRVLPKHYLENKDFESISMTPIVSSGPYHVKGAEPGRFLTFQRRSDYWGKDKAIMQGRYNFDTIHMDFYRDDKVALEAFKAGAYDIRMENDPLRWQNEYNFPALKDGRIKYVTLKDRPNYLMEALVFNTRRPLLSDRRVRQALSVMFDFEWLNKHLFQNAYLRSRSYFNNTNFASQGLPSDQERALLDPFKDQLPAEVFTEAFMPSATDGTGNIRPQMRTAFALLKEAGWEIKDNVLVHTQTGQPFEFEILLYRPSDEKVALAFARNLKRIGITATVRVVEPLQYEKRRTNFDFDIMVGAWGHSKSPGREQIYYWSSAAAQQPGSRNNAGVAHPAVDKLCTKIVEARTYEELETAMHALDRVLLWGYYSIPLYYPRAQYIAYWDKFNFPTSLEEGFNYIMTWWAKKK